MFEYQAQTFNTARRALMLPHPHGEAASIAAAFHECTLGLHQFRLDDLEESAREWVETLQAMMDTTGVVDPTGEGTWALKASAFTLDERYEVARLIDELAHWFTRSRG